MTALLYLKIDRSGAVGCDVGVFLAGLGGLGPQAMAAVIIASLKQKLGSDPHYFDCSTGIAEYLTTISLPPKQSGHFVY